jgi:hypothetical protein
MRLIAGPDDLIWFTESDINNHTGAARVRILQGVLSKIFGTPVITGLYTALIPTALFAVFGSSRHLVVGADSASFIIFGGAKRGRGTERRGLPPIPSPESSFSSWAALEGGVQ